MLESKCLHRIKDAAWYALFRDDEEQYYFKQVHYLFVVNITSEGNERQWHQKNNVIRSISSDHLTGSMCLNKFDQDNTEFIGLTTKKFTSLKQSLLGKESLQQERSSFEELFGVPDADNYMYTGLDSSPNDWWSLFEYLDKESNSKQFKLYKVDLCVAANALYSVDKISRNAELFTYSQTELGLLRKIPDQRYPGYKGTYSTYKAARAALLTLA